MQIENIYLTGNTIRLSANFKDMNENPIDPQLLKIKIYDPKYNLLLEQNLTSKDSIGAGKYQFDFTIPDIPRHSTFYYEFYGEINGVPALERGQFKSNFLN